MKTRKATETGAGPETGAAEMGGERDSSELDLRQRSRLLQSKLLGLPLTAHCWPTPPSSPQPSPRSQSNQDDARSLHSQSSGASSCSSQAPAPPPRLSSLASRRAAPIQREAANVSPASSRELAHTPDGSVRHAMPHSGRLSGPPLDEPAQEDLNYQPKRRAQATGRPLMQTPSQLAIAHQDNWPLVEPPAQFGACPASPPQARLANERHAITRHRATPPATTPTTATNYNRLECTQPPPPPPLAANRRQQQQQAAGLPARPLTKAIMRQEELKKQQFVKQQQQNGVDALANLQQAPTHHLQRHLRPPHPAFVLQPALVQKPAPMVNRRALRPLPPLPNESSPPAAESPQAPPRPPKSCKLGSISSSSNSKSNSTTSLASSHSNGAPRGTPVSQQQALLELRLEEGVSLGEVISSTPSSHPVSQTAPQISPDSVQLLVQQQQQQQRQQEPTGAKKGQEAGAPSVKLEVGPPEEAGAPQAPAPKQPLNDLLMVMQQRQPAMRDAQNNGPGWPAAAAAPFAHKMSSSPGESRGGSARSGQQAGGESAAPRASTVGSLERQGDRAGETEPGLGARVEQPAVRRRQLGQVERAISLHMLRRQQEAAADGAARLPTLAQLQAQMEAAKAQLRAARPATQQRADSAQADQRASGRRHGNASRRHAAGQSLLAACQSNTTTQHFAPTTARSNFAANAADSTQTPTTTTATQSSQQLEPISGDRQRSPQSTNSPIGTPNGAELNEATVLCQAERSKFDEFQVEASGSAPATRHERRQMTAERELRSEPTHSIANPTTPQPRPSQDQLQLQLEPIRGQLTISVTSPPIAQMAGQLEQQQATSGQRQAAAGHRRLRELAVDLSASCASSCQSTPTNCSSLLSSADSTLTSASSALFAQLNAANSSELIPKLIERLDRKLVVMKREQLALMREIEANELAGQRLFDAMRKRLTVHEFDKLNMQANEIDKVTKLILSLKLRLKRVEAELKERQPAPVRRASSRAELDPTSGHSSSSPGSSTTLADQLDRPRPTMESESDEQVQLRVAHTSQRQSPRSANPSASSATQTVAGSRGLSDPTSASGLPKRCHQHHASLQSAASFKAAANTTKASSNEAGQKHQHAASSGSGSSDSIFNSADSAIGGSCTLASDSSSSAHGGSSSNLNLGPKQLAASHSQSSSAASCSLRHSCLSSSVSVSSHSSMASSNPSSPSLMSPTNTQSAASAHQGQLRHSSNSTSTPPANGHEPASEFLDGASLMALKLVSELEILQAKRNKLLSQLEEAHQLEQCIVKRNGNILDRILAKYHPNSANSDESNEIAEFKQFAKLKSLLLKDSHDIADRIDSAELQLSELKQSAAEPL